MSNVKGGQTASGSQDLTGGVPLSVSFVVTEYIIEILSAHISSDVGITEQVQITRTSVVGAAYVFPLDTDNFNGEKKYNYLPGKGKVFAMKGDTITLSCTAANTTGEVVGQILYREDI